MWKKQLKTLFCLKNPPWHSFSSPCWHEGLAELASPGAMPRAAPRPSLPPRRLRCGSVSYPQPPAYSLVPSLSAGAEPSRGFLYVSDALIVRFPFCISSEAFQKYACYFCSGILALTCDQCVTLHPLRRPLQWQRLAVSTGLNPDNLYQM